MPRFFFDIDDGERQVVDQDGLELANLHQARDQAIAVLPEIARDHLPDGDKHEFTTIVRNESGATLFKATLALSSEWFDRSREHQLS